MSLHLIDASDAVLIGEAVTAAVDELVGDGDRGLMLEILERARLPQRRRRLRPAPLIDAARTPPFLTDRRVVVGRHVSRFSRKDDYGPLVDDASSELLDTHRPRARVGKGVEPKGEQDARTLPKALKEAIEVAGGRHVKTRDRQRQGRRRLAPRPARGIASRLRPRGGVGRSRI